MIIKYAIEMEIEVPDDTPENMIDAMIREKAGDVNYVYTTDGTSPIYSGVDWSAFEEEV